MKLVKSLLLGTATGLVAVAGGAQAADLPSRKAVPVEYVRVCAAHGVGFFYIPGTDVCLRVGGRVRAEYMWAETFSRNHDSIGFRARGRLNVDARTATPWGTLRTFFRFEMTRSSGTYQWANVDGPAFINSARNNGFLAQNANLENLDKAFIQWSIGSGVLTAGLVQSFFDFYADTHNWSGLRGADQGNAKVLAWTQSFGGGFSATIALEDRVLREIAGLAGPLGLPIGGPGAFGYAGMSLPDLVGVLRVDQGWGSAQLSGALHQIRTPLTPFGIIAGVPTGFVSDTDYGFALQAGVKINMPFLAPGDEFWLQAAYASGGVAFLGFGDSFLSNRANAGHINTTHADAVYDAAGNLHKTDGWAITAAFLHYWLPNLRQGIFGSYARIEYDAGATAPLQALNPGNTALARVCAPTSAFYAGGGCDTSEWRLGTQLIWSPIRNFDVGLELMYTHVDVSGATWDVKDLAYSTSTAAAGGLTPQAATIRRTKSSDDAFQARLRFQYDF